MKPTISIRVRDGVGPCCDYAKRLIHTQVASLSLFDTEVESVTVLLCCEGLDSSMCELLLEAETASGLIKARSVGDATVDNDMLMGAVHRVFRSTRRQLLHHEAERDMFCRLSAGEVA